jgi:hypothetical protein
MAQKTRWRGSSEGKYAYLWDLVLEQLHDDAAGGRAADGDVEEDVGVGHFDEIGGVYGVVESVMQRFWERGARRVLELSRWRGNRTNAFYSSFPAPTNDARDAPRPSSSLVVRATVATARQGTRSALRRDCAIASALQHTNSDSTT